MPLGPPHSEFLVVGLLFFAIGVVLLTVAKLWPSRRRSGERVGEPDVPPVRPIETLPFDEPARTIEPEPQPVAVAAPAPTWPGLIDPDLTELDQDARSRLLSGLGIVADRWSAGILSRAFDEETGALRVAAIEALGACDVESVAPLLERAYVSPLVDERYAAVEGASRRGDVPLLERALRDKDGCVALAAAYGLHRAGRDDLVETGLAARGDAQADEIRRLLPILA